MTGLSRSSCELLSDCIFDILVTTVRIFKDDPPLLWIAFRLYLWHIGHNRKANITHLFQLWIAFRLYLWHIGHNPAGASQNLTQVVNCFQIVSLTYWSQRWDLSGQAQRCCELLSDCIFDILVTTHKVIAHYNPSCELLSDCIFDILVTTKKNAKLNSKSCELLSDCIFDILVTTEHMRRFALDRLWIAFRLYLWHIGHNVRAIRPNAVAVVNCFQIVSLTYWSQQRGDCQDELLRCELLSDCIFDILVTTAGRRIQGAKRLWIAFRLYLWHIGHNTGCYPIPCTAVVNCFQIVSLTYWSQRFPDEFDSLVCCELLSDCIFDILVTTLLSFSSLPPMLWIAFRLYLWHIGHNNIALRLSKLPVVNCFQIVSLTYWSQHFEAEYQRVTVVNCFQIVSLTYWSQQLYNGDGTNPGCELLSDCIFDILVTTFVEGEIGSIELWIAFRLYLWHIGHNRVL